MNQESAARRWRATVVTVTLTLVVGGGIFLYLLLIGGPWFLAALATLAIVALVGLAHYLFWGRSFSRQAGGLTQGVAGGSGVNRRAASGRVLPGRGVGQP